ncbi:MAG: TIGR03617 family F420-dependent LLM class oxidoreductase, partial [Myxococcota bacterium]
TAHAALAATENLKVATSVLVVFPRSPMSVAVATWDLQEISGGRFELGLGPQVRGNIVKRYSTPWTAPAPRMREYVGSLRAIFDSWQNGAKLDFSGEHYQFTRMQPFFNPGPIEEPDIPIHLGAIGPAMTALAGEVADGMMCHPSNTAPRYLQEVVRPRLERGESRPEGKGRRTRLMVGSFVATGRDRDAAVKDREHAREQLGFLYSTPAYWPSLEMFGWREVGEALHAMSREGRWAEMPAVVSEDMLDAFVPTAPYAEIADLLRERYADQSDWITFPMPADPGEDAPVAEVIASLRAGS